MSTDRSRNLRDPAESPDPRVWGRDNWWREYITVAGLGWESEGAVVARKRGNARGAKGPC